MKKLLLFVVLLSIPSMAQISGFNGDCSKGNVFPLAFGSPTSNPFLGSFPQCTVTVYLTGTTTKTTIYSNASFGALSNPFTANVDGSWLFFAQNAIGVDIVMSGGTPFGMPSSRTLTDVIVGGGGGGGTPGGTSGQVQFNNAGLFAGLTNVAAGSVLASNGVSGTPGFQTKTVIDIRDVAGIDCTGATDSSTALNSLTSTQDTVDYKIIEIKNCALQVQTQWLIHGQLGLEIDLGESFHDSGNAAVIPGMGIIFGCNGAAGAVVRVDRSSNVNIHGGGIIAKGNSCSSSFTQSLTTTTSGAGGYTQTALRLWNTWLTSSQAGTPITNYVGFYVNGSPNQERYELHQVSINCQNSSGSVGIWQADANADSTTVRRSNINNCYRGIQNDNGNISIYDTTFGANGTFGTFGSGGATLYGTAGCWPVVENLVVAENSGQFLASGADNSGCQFTGVKQQVFINNNISFASIDSSVYPFNVGNVDIDWVLICNNFISLGAPVHNSTVIGSDSQGVGHGPLGYLFSVANNYDTTDFVQQDFNTNLGFQRGHFGGNDRSESNAINREPLELWLQQSPFPFANQGFLKLKTNNSNTTRLGFVGGTAQWAQNWNAAASTQDDTSKSSWIAQATPSPNSTTDFFSIQYVPVAGSSTTNLFDITGAGRVEVPVATGTSPFNITSTTPVANLTTVPTTYNHGGTQQTAVHLIVDRCTLGTNCSSITLSGSAVYTSSSSYNCVGNDETGANSVNWSAASGTTFTFTGTGTDAIAYICAGN